MHKFFTFTTAVAATTLSVLAITSGVSARLDPRAITQLVKRQTASETQCASTCSGLLTEINKCGSGLDSLQSIAQSGGRPTDAQAEQLYRCFCTTAVLQSMQSCIACAASQFPTNGGGAAETLQEGCADAGFPIEGGVTGPGGSSSTPVSTSGSVSVSRSISNALGSVTSGLVFPSGSGVTPSTAGVPQTSASRGEPNNNNSNQPNGACTNLAGMSFVGALAGAAAYLML